MSVNTPRDPGDRIERLGYIDGGAVRWDRFEQLLP
jgi:hypothetical protein